MNNKEHKIAAVVINWNRKDLTFACLKSLEPIVKSNKNFSIILVDNASKDDSVESFKKFNKKYNFFTLIVNKQNRGWAGGHNVGIIHALKQHVSSIFIFANDATVNKNTIKLLEKALFSNENVGIVGPKTYYPREKNKKLVIADAGGLILKHRYFGTNRGQGETDRGQYDKRFQPDYITGSCMLIKREVFEKIGFFDEKLFIYYEDVDFCYRAKKAGFDLLYVPQATIFHHFAATTKVGSPVHNYFTTRNHYLFIEKHAPIQVKLRELFRTPKTILELVRSKDKSRKRYSLLGIRDYYLRMFGGRVYW